MLPNENPQPGADVSRPDTINPLEDKLVRHDLEWLSTHYSILSGGEQQIASLAFKLWHHIQRLDGAWRIQQERLIALEEKLEGLRQCVVINDRRLDSHDDRIQEVERWQEGEDSYRLEQNEYEV